MRRKLFTLLKNLRAYTHLVGARVEKKGGSFDVQFIVFAAL